MIVNLKKITRNNKRLLNPRKKRGPAPVILTDRERKQRAVTAYKIRENIIIPVNSGAFTREPWRKPKETRRVYKRSQRNMMKALKARLRFGSEAQVYINKENYEVL